MPNAAYEQQLALLKAQYIEKLPHHLKEISSAWEHLQYINWDHKKLEQLTRACHRLAGSGASYGFADISTCARAIEDQLSGLSSQASAADRKNINQFLSRLTQAVNNAQASAQKDGTASLSNLPAVQGIQQPRKAIAIIEDDPDQAQLLKASLDALGYHIQLFSSPEAFSKDESAIPFDLIILDLSFPQGPLEGLFWLEEIHQRLKTHCPIMITSARSDFVARMRALRAGASAYITKPFDMHEVETQIAHCLGSNKGEAGRVLWVDDDVQLLALYQEILRHAGYAFSGLSQPVKILESLNTFRPDILIMDYQMPGCTGIELAAMLKQDARFMTIPIIFASGSPMSHEHQESINILGSAYIRKPINRDELLNCIKTQLNKARLLNQKIEQVSQRLDPNSLQTKAFFLNKLDRLLTQKSLADQSEKTFLVYATIDNPDYLKARFGLRNLSQISGQLEQFLACHPLIQGNGCAISHAAYLLLISVSKRESEQSALTSLLQSLNNQTWSVDNKTCKLSLTMSAMQLQQSANLDEIISRLELACFQAVSQGGNRIQWEKATSKSQLDERVKSLLQAKSFKLLFQPVVNLETDNVLFEALIRLQDQDGHTFTPDQFMPWLEDTLEGGAVALDRWLIEQAVVHLMQRTESSAPSLIIKLASSLNQIVNLLPEIRFACHPVSTRQNSHGAAKRLIFSLPISVIMNDPDKAKQIIESLEELGCGFMLEKVEPLEAHLKLVKDLGKIDYLKLRSTVKISKTLDQFIGSLQATASPPTLVVSGIEDSLMLAHYWEAGIRHFQGYFIQQPGEELLYKEQN